MGALSVLGEVIRDLLIFVGALTVLLIILVVVVAKVPAHHPAKRSLIALCYRIAATAAAGALAIPVEPIPGLDVLYDIGAPLLLIIYWVSFFKNIGRFGSNPPLRRDNRRLPMREVRAPAALLDDERQ